MVVEKFGQKPYPREKMLVYIDDEIEIRTHYNGLDLEITRKAHKDREEHLRVSNPTTMVAKGIIIRHHGEHAYLVDHLNSLYARC